MMLWLNLGFYGLCGMVRRNVAQAMAVCVLTRLIKEEGGKEMGRRAKEKILRTRSLF